MKRLLLYGICLFSVCWGCEDERQPQKAPVIANLTVTDITESSAKCTFKIDPVGAARQAGVIFGTEASLLSATTEISTTTLANGNISLTLSSLDIDTEYYYKAYISDKHNSFIYSGISQFRTKSLIIDMSVTSIAASYPAGSYKFTITSNGAWTITSNQEWCTVQPTSGNGDREITVSVLENTTATPRTATLTITAGNQSQQVTVEQEIDNTTLDVSVSTINASYSLGQHSFTIISNAEWTIASDEEWCTVLPTSGNGDQEITVSVTENNTEAPRTATLTITAGNHSQQVKVEQDIDNTTLDVSVSTINAPYTAGQHEFTITSNAEWTITSDEEWCIVQPTSGNNDQEITVSVTENTTEAPRTATLTITAGNLSRQVKVEQDIDITTLEVSVSTINAPYTAGQHTFTITSNAAWTITSDQNWCTVQPTSGNGDREITITVTENATGSLRTATLTVIASNQSKQVTVEQSIDNTALDVSVSTINTPFTSGQHSFHITSNAAWTIASNQNWCTVQPTSGNGDRDITITVTENTTGSLRTATLTITAGNQTKQVTVEQDTKESTEFGNGIIAAENYGGGDGTEGSPYLINNARQLKKLVDDPLKNRYSNHYFKLTTDIQVTVDLWVPIGNEAMSFSGNFNGNGHTISGTLKSNRYINFGFFGYTEGGLISNLTITGTVRNEYAFSCNTGAIVGRSMGNIIQDCIVNANVIGGYTEFTRTGGIIGYHYHGSITNCTTSGKIEGNGDFSNTGGIVGYTGGTISNCTNQAIVMGGGTTREWWGSHGSYTGGIAGLSENDIINCTVSSSGTITGGGAHGNETGGIAGRFLGPNGRMYNCTNNATVSGRQEIEGLVHLNAVGGLVGTNSGEIHSSLNIGNVSGKNGETGGLTGLNSELDYTHVYSCCTNQGTVNGQAANVNNQIGSGKIIETCPDGHTKR